jgi:tRNA(Ile)-lysidine synthase
MPKQKSPKTIDLTARAGHFLEHYQPPTGPGPLLVAVSGGPDSVCLFHLLLRLRDRLGIKLHVVHLDHQLRGDDAAADARYVGELARQFDVPATIDSRDVKAYRAQKHLSLEEAAREVRYTFFAEVAKSEKAAAVAVGHTRDDNIETILMHLIRGTGTRGLRGLSPVTHWHASENSMVVIRPLLDISRIETQQYCRDNQIETRTDPTNTSLSLFRNRIRLELRPMLESYNPQINEALLRMASIAGDDLAYLDDESQRLWKAVAKRNGNNVVLDKELLVALPAALKRHLLRMAMEALLGNLKDIETRHIEEMLDTLEKPAGKRIDLPGSLTFTVEYDRYILGPEPSGLCPFPVLKGQAILKVPGETLFSGWQISAKVLPGKEFSSTGIRRFRKNTISDEGKNISGLQAGLDASFDYDRLGKELTVRAIQPGDRFQPLGMNEVKKVSRFMIDARIPHAWRSRIPIITSLEHIIWVAGWRIDERLKVKETTNKVLTLKMELL